MEDVVDVRLLREWRGSSRPGRRPASGSYFQEVSRVDDGGNLLVEEDLDAPLARVRGETSTCAPWAVAAATMAP